METQFLLPNSFKKIGWIIAIPAFVLMIFNVHYEFTFPFLDYSVKKENGLFFDEGFLFNLHSNNFTDEIGSVLLLTGLLLIAFSKEKDEDERISQLRLESLLWAVFINTILIIISIIFFYNVLFLQVMVYNICTTLILFIIRFNLKINSERKILKRVSL